jgi:hypothetical protein
MLWYSTACHIHISYLQTPIRITTPASRFLHAAFLARYATLLARYATLLARYATLLARYDTLLALYATQLKLQHMFNICLDFHMIFSP